MKHIFSFFNDFFTKTVENFNGMYGTRLFTLELKENVPKLSVVISFRYHTL